MRNTFVILSDMPEIIFRNSCPNCGGEIDSKRLALGVPCKLCLPLSTREIEQAKEKMSKLEFLKYVASKIRLERGRRFKEYIDLELEAEKMNELSQLISGNKLYGAQLTWAKRLLKGISFSITAPTGLGKTYFGIIAAIYYAMKGKKTLFVVPTAALVSHVLGRFSEALKKIKNNKIAVVGYHARMPIAKKRNFMECIKNGNFDIVVITSRFLATNFDILKKYVFDLIFVDDVDALLKSSENIDRVLYLIGFKKKHIDKALRLVRRKQNFAVLGTGSRKKLLEDTRKFREEIAEYKRKNKIGQIIVSSATGTTRGLRVKILRELLDFTIGSVRGGLRNIVDAFYLIKPGEKNVVVNLVRKLGKGGVIFLDRIRRGFVDKLIKSLEKIGFRVGDATKPTNIDKLIEAFANEELDILIGAASYYGKLARGLDIPQMIRYAIFVGVPHFKFPLEITDKTHPFRGYVILNEIVEFVEDRKKQMEILRLISNFRRRFMRLKFATRQLILNSIFNGTPLPTKKLEAIKEICLNILRTAKELLSDEKIVNRLKESPFVEVKEIKGRLYIYIPDAKTYIQGSGRTSRLYPGGITKGLAVIVTHRQKLLDGLRRRARIYADISEWYDFRELDIDSVLSEIDRDREKLRRIISGEITPEFRELMRSALVVVESPTKAKTIAKFFGRPARRIIRNFIVYEASAGKYILNIMATRGHVFDLILEDVEVSDISAMRKFFDVDKNLYGVRIIGTDGYVKYVPEYDIMGICKDCGKRFTGLRRRCPRCGSENVILQSDVLEALCEIASEVNEILIATDPDAEGEKIGFDIALALAPYAEKISRIEYHAVTPSEFRKALENPRGIDLNRVKAQLVRRIVDRWVGFTFSHLLWKLKHIKKKFFSYSAGRVQTPVLGWIIERFDEYKKNKINVYFIHLSNGYFVSLEENSIPKEVWQSLVGKKVKVKIVKAHDEVINPPPPYTTADLLKDISAQLRIRSTETMRILQELFESGLITYHRTDSTRVSPEGINVAKEFIRNEYGDMSLFQPRAWGGQEEGAHECIRPTMPITANTLIRMLQTEELVLPIRFTKKHFAVYQQIFRRFIASQMKPAKVRKGCIELIFDSRIKHRLEGILDVLEPGFMMIYPYNTLPKFDNVKVERVQSLKISKVPLYNESEIIDKMRAEGIGRPSTYAIILDILFKRGYIKTSLYRNKIFPLKRGIMIYTSLIRNIESYARKLERQNKKLAERLRSFITVEGTRDLEREMDKVEKGKVDYQRVLKKIHEVLSTILKDLSKYYTRELIPAIEKMVNSFNNENKKQGAVSVSKNDEQRSVLNTGKTDSRKKKTKNSSSKRRTSNKRKKKS